MSIAQGATPYIMITVKGHDLSGADALVVTLKTLQYVLNLDLERVTVTAGENDTLLTMHLSQEETLAMASGTAVVQVRWRKNGEAHTTEMVRIDVSSVIYREVI